MNIYLRSHRRALILLGCIGALVLGTLVPWSAARTHSQENPFSSTYTFDAATLHRIDTSTLGSQASGTFRSHVAFAPSRPGQYRLSVRVTLGNQTRSKSATIQVVR